MLLMPQRHEAGRQTASCKGVDGREGSLSEIGESRTRTPHNRAAVEYSLHPARAVGGKNLDLLNKGI